LRKGYVREARAARCGLDEREPWCVLSRRIAELPHDRITPAAYYAAHSTSNGVFAKTARRERTIALAPMRALPMSLVPPAACGIFSNRLYH